MDLTLLGRLRRILIRLYPGGDAGFAEFSLEVSDELGDGFVENISSADLPSQKFQSVLLAVRAASREADLLEMLVAGHDHALDLAEIYKELRAAYQDHWPNAQVGQRRSSLKAQFLICNDYPLVDRRSFLAKLNALVHGPDLTRVGVVTGADLCGKSWIRHLVRSKCQMLGCALVDLDLKEIEPGNDARMVCDLLLQKMDERNAITLRKQDTKSGQYVQRLAYEVGKLRQRMLANDHEARTLVIMIDSLNKNIGPDVIDFVDFLISAASTTSLPETRLLLIGYPKDSARHAFTEREVINPITESDVADYYANVASTLGHPLEDAERVQIAKDAIAIADMLPNSPLADRQLALSKMSQEIRRRVEHMVMA